MAIGMTVKEGREGFLDRPKVIAILGKKTADVLLRWAFKIRDSALRSIRNRKYGVSAEPGEAPYSHVGFVHARINRARRKAGLPNLPKQKGEQRGIKAIEARYDFATGTVVIGAIKFDSATQVPTVPHLLEFGGTLAYHRPPRESGKDAGYRIMTYAPHPYMAPALLANPSPVSSMWAAAVA